jgi:hypothetical protein
MHLSQAPPDVSLSVPQATFLLRWK